jgi:zinc transporter 1
MLTFFRPFKLYFVASGANQNIKAVLLHVLGDALGSVGVIISALLYIYKDQLRIDDKYIVYVDPILSIIIICIIIAFAVPLCKNLTKSIKYYQKKLF